MTNNHSAVQHKKLPSTGKSGYPTNVDGEIECEVCGFAGVASLGADSDYGIADWTEDGELLFCPSCGSESYLTSHDDDDL